MMTVLLTVAAWFKNHPQFNKYAVVFLLGIGAHGIASKTWDHFHPLVPQVVTNEVTHTTTVTVPGPVTTQTVDKLVYVTDKTEAKALLAENAQLKIQVHQLNETLGSATSHGGGPVEPPTVVTTEVPTTVHFKDWRLDFTSDGKNAKYDLTQKFEVLSTTGRDPQGRPLSIVKVFEVGPGTAKTEIPTQTISVVTDETASHWHVSPAIQAGLFVGKNTTGNATVKGAVVGMQWLKKGRTTAAEDSTVSLLTPVIELGETKEIGVLPFSVNLGRIPHQPLKDLWVSPYFGTDNFSTPKLTSFGISFTATF